jgi:hypothetical protein
MQAKVNHVDGFRIFSLGRTDTYPLDTVLGGFLAEKAVAAGRAVVFSPAKTPPRNKMKKPPENKG